MTYGHGREYWRAYGFILAWPLNVYNIFTHEPLWAWIAIGFVQTFVLIPLGIYFFGKGVYCGWICSCGALAETLGDTHRQKMPHGPKWNRLNMAGQAVLAIAFLLLAVRIVGWILPDGNVIDHDLRSLAQDAVQVVRRRLSRRRGRVRRLLLVLGARLVPVLLPARRAHARLRALQPVRDRGRQEEVHLVQRVHVGLPPGHRRHELREQGGADADPECVRCSACVESCPPACSSSARWTAAAGRSIWTSSPLRRC